MTEAGQTSAQSPETSGPLMLADLTTDDVAELKTDLQLILVPVGAHEQHGPALPVSTDTLTAHLLCSLTSTLLKPRVAVAPTIPWGVSWHHLGKMGTISLREETLIALTLDIVSSLANDGHQRIVLVNTHGGNNPALAIAAERAHRELGVPLIAPVYGYALIANAAAEILGPEAIGHGGGDEASAVLAIRPDLVHTELLANPDVDQALQQRKHILRAAGGTLPVMQHLVTPSGTTGDARGATSEAGNAILGRAVAQLRAIIEDLLDAPLPQPPHSISPRR